MYQRKETHMKKGNKRYKISIGIFFCSLLFIMPFGIAYAKEYGNVIIKAIIQKDGDDRHALQNVSFAIYKVADVRRAAGVSQHARYHEPRRPYRDAGYPAVGYVHRLDQGHLQRAVY